MIRKEDVADLREGDVVEIRFASGSLMRGPLTADGYGGEPLLGIADVHWPLRLRDGGVQHYLKDCTLTVVARAPRPLYVNHPRTEPVMGDVVSRGDTDGAAWSYCPRGVRVLGNRWRNTANDEWFADEDFIDWGNGLRLLVDGETGDTVPAVRS